jgi:hypothetical protein
LTRRGFLGGLVAGLAAAGCGAAKPPSPAPPHEEARTPLHTSKLTGLLPLSHLRWVILVRPREIASIPWLIPSIGAVVPEKNLDLFAQSSGIDLRQIPEAVIASYAGEGGGEDASLTRQGAESTFYLVRHRGDPQTIERAFRKRLTSGERRVVERPDLHLVSGRIGVSTSSLVVIGRDIIGLQSGGSGKRGPARIAALYAADKLKKSPTVLSQDPLRSLSARFGGAPLRALSLGPFEGELARGARGLLTGATAIGASARPSAREGIALVVAVAGDFTKSGEPASRELAEAWRELAESAFGRLFGLDQPIERPLATHSEGAVAVAVELSPQKLARGIAAETSGRIEEIMR